MMVFSDSARGSARPSRRTRITTDALQDALGARGTTPCESTDGYGRRRTGVNLAQQDASLIFPSLLFLPLPQRNIRLDGALSA